MYSHAIVVGIGGTGAKCLEALVHLAASGHAPDTVYPVLIDQDRDNGNVRRADNVLKTYLRLRSKARTGRSWFFRPDFVVQQKLLPMVPQELNANYRAAIGMSAMDPDEAAVVNALFTRSQLDEVLDAGYKKRAHMGSLLIEKMFESESARSADQGGLLSVVEQTKKIPSVLVLVAGSLFGGTGASGLVSTARYFRRALPHARVAGVFLTPYFLIGRSDEGNKDANLVKSDADMQAVKTFLQMYKGSIEESFHDVFIAGSEIRRLSNEFPTESAQYGGPTQVNPAHPFELFAAGVPLAVDEPEPSSCRYWSFAAKSTRDEPPITFTLSEKYPGRGVEDAPLMLHTQPRRLTLVHDFASMLVEVQNHDERTWWARQPWADAQHRIDLVNWAKEHVRWWRDISPDLHGGFEQPGRFGRKRAPAAQAGTQELERRSGGRRWGAFNVRVETQIPTYLFSAYLSRYFTGSPSDLSSLFATVDALGAKNLREVAWDSI